MKRDKPLTCGKVQCYVVAEIREAALSFGNVVGTVTEDLSVQFWERDTGLDHLFFPIG